jgi:DNA repair exonuclease SbcCD ATPase subunit
MSEHELKVIRRALAERLGAPGDTWLEILAATDALVQQRDELKSDASQYRTSFHKARRKLRALEGTELSEAVSNGASEVVTIKEPSECRVCLKPIDLEADICGACYFKRREDSTECPTCSRVIEGACPACRPIEFVEEVSRGSE